MHLFCVLIGVVALVGTAVHAQPEDNAPAEEPVALEAEAPAIHAPRSCSPQLRPLLRPAGRPGLH